MRRPSILTILLAAMLVAYAAPARAASITLDSVAVGSNQDFTLAVRAFDIEDLIAYAFNVVYDPAFVELKTVADGGALGQATVEALPCTYPGLGADEIPCGTTSNSVSVGNFRLLGSGVDIDAAGAALTQLTFHALADGLTTVTLTLISMDTIAGSVEGLPDSVPADVRIGEASVPEPSTIVLLSLGIAGFARRRCLQRPR